jgi:hypothetical protein
MTMPENPLYEKLLHKAVFGGSMGLGAYVAYLCFEILKAQPVLAIQTIGQWGALPILMGFGMYFGNARVSEFIGVLRENTTAQQELAGAVKQIAEKDDRQAERMSTMTAYVGQKMGEILEQQQEILSRLNSTESMKAKGATG